MNCIEGHIGKRGTLILKKENGEESIFTLKPLTYEFLPKIMSFMKGFKDNAKLNDNSITEEEKAILFINSLDVDSFKIMGDLCYETMIRSYPNLDKEELKEFVSSNLFKIFPIVIELNIPKK